MTIADAVRSFIRENFLFGGAAPLGDQDSLLDAGIIDSTGAMEVVSFLEARFDIRIDDHDLVPDNLDSIAAITAFVTRKLPQTQLHARSDMTRAPL